METYTHAIATDGTSHSARWSEIDSRHHAYCDEFEVVTDLEDRSDPEDLTCDMCYTEEIESLGDPMY